MTWANGKLSKAVIRSTLDGPCAVRYQDKTAVFQTQKDGAINLDDMLRAK